MYTYVYIQDVYMPMQDRDSFINQILVVMIGTTKSTSFSELLTKSSNSCYTKLQFYISLLKVVFYCEILYTHY